MRFNFPSRKRLIKDRSLVQKSGNFLEWQIIKHEENLNNIYWLRKRQKFVEIECANIKFISVHVFVPDFSLTFLQSVSIARNRSISTFRQELKLKFWWSKHFSRKLERKEQSIKILSVRKVELKKADVKNSLYLSRLDIIKNYMCEKFQK